MEKRHTIQMRMDHDWIAAARAEAARNFGGNLSMLVRFALAQYLRSIDEAPVKTIGPEDRQAFVEELLAS